MAISQQLIESLVPSLARRREGALQEQTLQQRIQADQQRQKLDKINIAQAGLKNVAQEANALLAFDKPEMLHAALVRKAQEVTKAPREGVKAEEFIDMANRLGEANGFNTIRKELEGDILRVQDIQGQLARQKFIGTPQRVSEGGKNFLVGVVQTPEGGFREERVEIAGDFVSPLGETAGEQKTRKLETERSLNQILADRQKNKALASGEAQRLGDFIEKGVTAVDSLPNVQRGLELLKSVRTGGIVATAKKVTDFFGTTSGDVSELSRILGQNVLAGLANFTGAISEGERRFLERMEANLAAGTEFNLRELQRMERMYTRQIGRAKKAAKVSGDTFSLDIFNESRTAQGFGQQGSTDQGSLPAGLPEGTTDNGDGTFTLPTGQVVEPE